MKMSQGFLKRHGRKLTGGALFVAVLFMVPMSSFAGTKRVYVDDSNTSGAQDGTSAHPYRTIKEGLKHVNDDDTLQIEPGYYKENIDIPDTVKVMGYDRKGTVIEASDNDRPTVTMNHKSSLERLTVKGGSHGVYVAKKSRATLYRVTIEKSDKDGVHAREADIKKDKYALLIIESEIKNADRAGIFSEKRKVVIVDTEIYDNGSDGIDIAKGSNMWITKNTVRDNGGSGLKVSVDHSSIFVAKKNTFRDNKHEGIEVNAYGQYGMVAIEKSKFINNKKYGIAKIARTKGVPSGVWKSVTEKDNAFSSNNVGTVSPVLTVLQ
jgi:hypothetical protein